MRIRELNSRRVVCLTKRWHHHTASGGYDRLAVELQAQSVSRQNWIGSLRLRVLRKAWQAETRTRDYLLDYQFGDLLAEFRALAICRRDPPDALHVLYGDEQLDLLLRYRSLLRGPLVASFHLPPARCAQRLEIHQKALGPRLDAAIVVSRNLVPIYENWIGKGKVRFIPHGVDTQCFAPADTERSHDGLRCVVVGDHMRDWATLQKVIELTRGLDPRLHFDVVTKEDNWSLIANSPNVKFYSGIPEQELVRLYQNALVAFIPVTDATANNAVLESMACGTPVIATRTGGMTDYVSDKAGWLLPRGDAHSAAKLLSSICSNPAIAQTKGAAARQWALQFDWERVAGETRAVYDALPRRTAA